MVPTPSGKGVILIGGYNDSHRRTSNLLLELTGQCLASLRWNIMELRLKIQRSQHLTFFISDYLTMPKSGESGNVPPIRDFSRAEVPNRIFHDPRYGRDNSHNPHLTGYFTSQFKFPIHLPTSRTGRSWRQN